jgi:hypothetical protein
LSKSKKLMLEKLLVTRINEVMAGKEEIKETEE